MSKEKITLKEVRESGMKKWKYLMEHGALSDFKDIPFYDEMEGYHSKCGACEYVRINNGNYFDYNECFKHCPIVGSIGHCTCSVDNVFDKWDTADSAIDRAYYAKKIYEAHEAIEVEEEAPNIEVGDTIRVGGHERTVVWRRDNASSVLYATFKEDVPTSFEVSNCTFISRPEKPVEYVWNGCEVWQCNSGPEIRDSNGQNLFGLGKLHCNGKRYTTILREEK
jgi:hypothetical protein